MAALAFTQATIAFYTLYFIIICAIVVLWRLLWKAYARRDEVSGRKCSKTFFQFCLWDPGEPFKMFANWFVVVVFIFNLLRLVCTIIFGFSPAE